MNYEIAITNVLVENTMDVEANSEQEAINKALDMVDKAAKELGITVSYSIESIDHIRTFDDLLNELKSGTTFEELSDGYVECNGNEVYEDNDLYDFIRDLGADIEDFGVGFTVICSYKKYYEVPYETRGNRFGDDLPDETVLIFDYNRIYDVTENY